MQTQINWAINSAKNDKVLPEMLNIMCLWTKMAQGRVRPQTGFGIGNAWRKPNA